MLSHPHPRTIKAPDIVQCNLLPVRQVSRQISRLYDQYLVPVALTSSQFVILAFIYANPGMSMRELGRALMMERSSLLRAIKPLTRDHLIRAVRQAALGARQFVFYLTETGEARHTQARPLWRAAQLAFDGVVGELLSAASRCQLSELANALVSIDPNGSARIPPD
jgi:DNA-binding MarR family transcriptional regulator